MMTHELQVSFISAPLAAIDRRSLSQAWYSALRLGSGATPVPQRTVQANISEGWPTRDPSPRMSTPKSLAVPAAAARVVRAPGATRGANGAVERRATRSPLATRIERELREKPSVRRTSTIRVGTGAERVMVLLQCGNRGARLVAVCAPVARKCVERALAQARYALAARGIELAYSVTPEAACS